MFHPQKRCELLLARPATKGAPSISEPGMLQHFRQKCRLQLLRDAPDLIKPRLRQCGGRRITMHRNGQHRVCHEDTSHSTDFPHSIRRGRKELVRGLRNNGAIDQIEAARMDDLLQIFGGVRSALPPAGGLVPAPQAGGDFAAAFARPSPGAIRAAPTAIPGLHVRDDAAQLVGLKFGAPQRAQPTLTLAVPVDPAWQFGNAGHDVIPAALPDHLPDLTDPDIAPVPDGTPEQDTMTETLTDSVGPVTPHSETLQTDIAPSDANATVVLAVPVDAPPPPALSQSGVVFVPLAIAPASSPRQPTVGNTPAVPPLITGPAASHEPPAMQSRAAPDTPAQTPQAAEIKIAPPTPLDQPAPQMIGAASPPTSAPMPATQPPATQPAHPQSAKDGGTAMPRRSASAQTPQARIADSPPRTATAPSGVATKAAENHPRDHAKTAPPAHGQPRLMVQEPIRSATPPGSDPTAAPKAVAPMPTPLLTVAAPSVTAPSAAPSLAQVTAHPSAEIAKGPLQLPTARAAAPPSGPSPQMAPPVTQAAAMTAPLAQPPLPILPPPPLAQDLPAGAGSVVATATPPAAPPTRRDAMTPMPDLAKVTPAIRPTPAEPMALLLDDQGLALSQTGPTTTASSVPAAFPAQAQAAAQQIIAALAAPDGPRHGDHPIEIALDPPELGRVRLTLTEVNGAMTLSITADRAETVDLMRRHLDLLSQEFARAGLGGPSVNLSHGNGGGTSGRGQPHPEAAAADTPPDLTPTPPRNASRAGSLDLRL